MNNINDRVLKESDYIIKTKKTVREIADVFNISKSTVHKDLQERLPKINKSTAEKVKKILDEHIKERHIRGGQSTKNKYQKLK